MSYENDTCYICNNHVCLICGRCQTISCKNCSCPHVTKKKIQEDLDSLDHYENEDEGR